MGLRDTSENPENMRVKVFSLSHTQIEKLIQNETELILRSFWPYLVHNFTIKISQHQPTNRLIIFAHILPLLLPSILYPAQIDIESIQ